MYLYIYNSRWLNIEVLVCLYNLYNWDGKRWLKQFKNLTTTEDSTNV